MHPIIIIKYSNAEYFPENVMVTFKSWFQLTVFSKSVIFELFSKSSYHLDVIFQWSIETSFRCCKKRNKIYCIISLKYHIHESPHIRNVKLIHTNHWYFPIECFCTNFSLQHKLTSDSFFFSSIFASFVISDALLMHWVKCLWVIF